MTTSEIREWAEKYGDDIHDVMDRVEPRHIVWLTRRCDFLEQENVILRDAHQKIMGFSHEKSRAFATSLAAVAEADDVWRNDKKL